MRGLLSITIVVFLTACTFNPDLGDKYYSCKPDGTCPAGCRCLEGQACVPRGDHGPEICAWCEDGQTLCRGVDEIWCTHLKSDPKNCGSCSNACNFPNAEADCIEGACVIIECLDCYQDCDQQAHNGCESCTDSDVYNCGECGTTCFEPPPATCEGEDLLMYLDEGDCVSSQCEYTSSIKPCPNGCENGFCQDDPCAQVTCDFNQHCEDGDCVCDYLWDDCDTNNLNGCETYVNTTDDCGECGFKCGVNSICLDGGCDCQYGFGDCDDNWGTGCEEDLLHNNLHCGDCDDDCATGLTCCNGQCVDTYTDRGNCGRCNTFCVGMTECCWGTCTDTQLNPENCGDCGNVCTHPDDACCWGSCVDLTADDQNCGECGVTCAQNIPCHQGGCGDYGIYCGTETCDFLLEECCYGANGISCYLAGNCAVRVVECDDDSDCGDLLYCCLVDTPEHITVCTSNCANMVCTSDSQCADLDPQKPYCCTGDYYSQLVNTCSSEFCQ